MVRVETDGPVAIVTIDRPAAKNAVDRETAARLADAFRAFDADPEQRVAVLDGAGGTFCAGADLKAFAGGGANRVEPDGDGPMGPSRMLLGKPVIAAIGGHAVAGGLELALWCDLRIAEEGAVLGVFCRRFGVPLIDGGTIRLPRLIGLSRALDLILTGRAVDAAEALAIGLVHRVVPRGQSRAAAVALAHQLAALPQAAMLADRQSAYLQHDLELPAALRQELELGKAALAEAFTGAQRFASGAGRHGEPTSVKSALLGLVLGASLCGCIVRNLVAGPRLTGTCAGACEHYVGCKPGHPEAARLRCLDECPDTITDPESLMMFESLSCRDTLAFVDGEQPATAEK